jgi:hypothetical protein
MRISHTRIIDSLNTDFGGRSLPSPILKYAPARHMVLFYIYFYRPNFSRCVKGVPFSDWGSTWKSKYQYVGLRSTDFVCSCFRWNYS